MASHRIPSHLSEGSQTWLSGLRDEKEWTASQWRLLLLAAEAWDRSSRARRQLDREGLTVKSPILSKKGDVVGERITAHPATGIAERNSALFSKLVGQLDLDASKVGLPDEEPDATPDANAPGGILLRLHQRTG